MMEPTPLRPDEQVAGGFLVLRLGGESFTAKVLPMALSRKWLETAKSAFVDIKGSAEGLDSFEARTRAKNTSFQENASTISQLATTPGATRGKAMRRKSRHARHATGTRHSLSGGSCAWPRSRSATGDEGEAGVDQWEWQMAKLEVTINDNVEVSDSVNSRCGANFSVVHFLSAATFSRAG